MSARKTERLLNLVICLLATRRYLSVAQIHAAVPGYGGEDSEDEAFRRMFERDKEELRELGIPLETGSNSVWDDEPGYRIARRDYELPEITLAADEAAALGLAARLWRSATLAEAAASALLKLRAAGVNVLPDGLTGLEPRVEASEPAFDSCLAAVRAGQALRFGYRTAGGTATVERQVEPWGVVSWRGRWYLVGHDRDRAATRVFRLSRMRSAPTPQGPVGAVVPPSEGLDLLGEVRRVEAGPREQVATVRVRRGRAYELRRRATREQQLPGDDGWDELELAYADTGRLADDVVGYGPDAIVLEPAELRDDVVRRLATVAR